MLDGCVFLCLQTTQDILQDSAITQVVTFGWGINPDACIKLNALTVCACGRHPDSLGRPSLVELFQTGEIIIARNYQSFRMYAILAVIYLIMITLLTRLAKRLEKRLK